MKKMKWAAMVIGIGMIGLFLVGCTDAQGSAGEWEADIGALEGALSEVYDLARSNAESIQALQQQIESRGEGGPPEGAQPRELEEIEQLNEAVATLNQALDALSARVSQVETSLSQRGGRSSGSSSGWGK